MLLKGWVADMAVATHTPVPPEYIEERRRDSKRGAELPVDGVVLVVLLLTAVVVVGIADDEEKGEEAAAAALVERSRAGWCALVREKGEPNRGES